MRTLFPELPKALIPLQGESMVSRVVRSVEASCTADEIVVVVSPANGEVTRSALARDAVSYAVQETARGTGDAIRSARAAVSDERESIGVVCADQPLLRASTIRRIVEAHRARPEVAVTMGTVVLPDFNEWRTAFADWGRVLRAQDGHVARIVEKRNATSDEQAVTEVNPSLYCFRAPWIWDALAQLTDSNAQGEYLLTDVVALAVESGRLVAAVKIDDPRETLGANTPEQLAVLETMLPLLA